jgi:hypothetical protein
VNIGETANVGALLAAFAALGGLYYQRAQMRLLERQTITSERELGQRVKSLDEVVNQLEEERRTRELAIGAERQARLAEASIAAGEFTSATLSLAGLTASWQYHTSLCVAVLASHLQSIAAVDTKAAGEANAVKELAASLVMVQVAFNELTNGQSESEEAGQQRLDRVKTAAEIFGLSTKRFSRLFLDVSLPPPDFSEVLKRLQRKEELCD